MLYANLNGAKLAYEVCGDGPPLIFVHGFLARSTGDYYSRLKLLLAKKYRVYAIDMRSHGGSADISERVTLKQCAEDVVAFAKRVEAPDAVLVGHSMGGYIAMAAAVIDPSPFQALALLTPAASKGQPFPEEFIQYFMAARRNLDLMFQQFSAMFMRQPGNVELRTLCDAALCLSDDIAEQWLRQQWSRHDMEGEISSIGLPVLSLIGLGDTVVPPDVQYKDALRIPTAKVVTLTDQGHMLPLENPDFCALEISRFLEDRSGDREG